MDVAATMEVAALIGKNNAKDRFISCSRQPVEGLSSSRLDVLGAKPEESEELTNHMQGGVPTAERMVTGKSANQQRSANKQSASRTGSARRTGCIVERIAPRSAPGSYGSVGDRGPSSTRDEQS